MKPHKHAELIKAWADGAEIEIKFYEGWRECRPIDWDENAEFRIKPEPKPDVVEFYWVERPYMYMSSSKTCNLKIIFDGETGKLKSAEVL